MIKQGLLRLVLLGFSCLLAACGGQKIRDDQTQVEKAEPTIQTNFYQAINKDWLNGGWLSSGTPFYNEFTRLQMEVDEQLKSDFDKMVAGQLEPQSEDLVEFIKLYQQGLDFTKREEDGVRVARMILDEMMGITSFSELKSLSQDWIRKDYPLPYGLDVIANPRNTSERMLILLPPQTILPDKSYYEDRTVREKLMDSYRISVRHILEKCGYSDEEATALVEGAIAFDNRLVDTLPASENVHSDLGPVNAEELRTFSEVKNYSPALSIGEQLVGLVGLEPGEVYVSNPSYFEQLSQFIKEENFSEYRSWALVSQAMKLAPYLTGEIMQTAGRFHAEVQGVSASYPNDYMTYLDVTGIFKESLGVYYGHNYADETDLLAIQEMAEAISRTYQERIIANDWLSQATKQAAIKKLENITYHIGYPRELSDWTKSLKVREDLSYIENVLAITIQARTGVFERYSQPIDRQTWASNVSASEVTAAYAPSQNAIYIPTAILQAPYYDKNQSVAENYGGIGKIIAHEFVHAFDATGANFDETGSLKDWWTERDRLAFEEKNQVLVDLFDGLEVYGGRVDGHLTLSENLADLGGIQIALSTLKKEEPSANLKEFFEHYARSRREMVAVDYGRYQLQVDTHSPEEFRVNLQLQQIDDFYKVYHIQEGDPMYRAPEERLVMW
ncbi:TPA: M13 family metallopeptidase [Streptococcus suis]|uniref:M13 family metallopeptidase n=1 Tax=Streptococcus suis TaxID=1307 RepID=UPI0003FD2D29|nr:M13 family metallopeptidase [Streptococcus suis]HEM3174282.1 M13 family metallopeptidase [Streptococcus suis]HEM4060150.1 M13 family metallopeptidase [Streptococcus suis]